MQTMCTNFREKKSRFDGGTVPRETRAVQCTPKWPDTGVVYPHTATKIIMYP